MVQGGSVFYSILRYRRLLAFWSKLPSFSDFYENCIGSVLTVVMARNLGHCDVCFCCVVNKSMVRFPWFAQELCRGVSCQEKLI